MAEKGKIVRRAQQQEDISHLDAYSSTDSRLVLPWHSDSLHCQLLDHSRERANARWGVDSGKVWPRHADHQRNIVVGSWVLPAGKMVTTRCSIVARGALRWTRWLGVCGVSARSLYFGCQFLHGWPIAGRSSKVQHNRPMLRRPTGPCFEKAVD